MYSAVEAGGRGGPHASRAELFDDFLGSASSKVHVRGNGDSPLGLAA